MEQPGIQSAPPTTSDRFQQVLAPLQPAFAALDEFFERQVAAFEPEVQPLVRYCFGHSGKKLRPVLVFSMAGQPGSVPDAGIIQAAAIVELVHLATLVHDDILDEADVRHRTETVVAKYGPHVAVLLGDALFSHALHLAAQYPDSEVCRVVSRATRQVCSGEIAQTFARGGDVPDPDAYYRMIDLKTAELFTVSAYLGGLLSGFDRAQLDAARAFARHLGIAYQIYDDAADLFAEEAVAGKTLGTDLATGKFTLPLLLWLNGMDPAARGQALDSLRAGGNGRIDVATALRGAGVLEAVGQAFRHQLELSRRAIVGVPGADRRAQLRALAEFVGTAWNKFSIR